MTRRPPTNLAASVHDRLLARARTEGRPFDELLQYYVIERFLYRLSRSRHSDRLVLKGALMLQFWGGPLSRSTRDIDLMQASSATVERMVQIVRDILAVKVGDDGLLFDAGSLRGESIRVEAEYHGVRLTCRAVLGKAVVRLQVDVGFGDAITPRAREILYPSLLDFGPAKLLGYVPETAVAEKLQAMVVLDMANSRMKDFFDIWLLATKREFAGALLRDAIRATFARRRTDLPEATPVALAPAFSQNREKQTQWRAYLRKARVREEAPTLREVADLIASFVMPVVESGRLGASFDRRWPPGGPWL